MIRASQESSLRRLIVGMLVAGVCLSSGPQRSVRGQEPLPPPLPPLPQGGAQQAVGQQPAAAVTLTAEDIAALKAQLSAIQARLDAMEARQLQAEQLPSPQRSPGSPGGVRPAGATQPGSPLSQPNGSPADIRPATSELPPPPRPMSEAERKALAEKRAKEEQALALRAAKVHAENITSRAPLRDDRHVIRIYPESWLEAKRRNVVMQQRDYSCGAAALATLLQYHWGDNVSELEILVHVVRMLTPEEMRERVENGLSLTDLRRVAVKMGYQATIGKLEIDKLKESKIPLIVGIVVEGFDHFVVYRGMDDRFVYVADPARGNVRTPIDVFQKQWQQNAVLVVVKPGGDLQKVSPLAVQDSEKFFGELNRRYLRDQATAEIMPW